MSRFTENLSPPYYAVMFSNQLRSENFMGYNEMAEAMDALAKTMPGYLGIESTRDSDGFGITISYWESEEAIKNWRENGKHLTAQSKGKTDWYDHYEVRIAKVERAYAGPKGR